MGNTDRSDEFVLSDDELPEVLKPFLKSDSRLSLRFDGNQLGTPEQRRKAIEELLRSENALAHSEQFAELLELLPDDKKGKAISIYDLLSLVGKLSKDKIVNTSDTISLNNNFNKIPVIGVIRAGEPLLAEHNIIGHIELPSELIHNGGQYFGLRVIGDSMNLSRINEGDIAIIRKQSHLENGEIGVILIGGEDGTIKRFYQTDTTITLVPNSSNPKHVPRIVDPSKTPITVLGKLVQAVILF